ncbi:YitT family protein [Sinorhizobium sp. BG8]|uniref:YitT family protein n=1 Tax=Sinorhizobium sp. BG8 TaxID=2613773 RepID=UPI00193CC7B2|nr:YitT family protein [Sinorhizobium sp. BG8]QRM54135.1 YitT family protein [Sinorhizobium sp. BG8]
MSSDRRRFGFWNPVPTRHSPLEDAQGIFTGSMVAALGLSLLGSAGLVASGVAGLAFVLHYLTGHSFGLYYTVINLPFYALSLSRLGIGFTIKTFIAVGLTSLITEIQPRFLEIESLNPIWTAVLAGILLGYGLLALYRHRASLGGLGILAVYLQDRFGGRAGLVQLSFDVFVLAAAFAVAAPFMVLCSVIGALILNIFLTINHRSDRYVAM